MFAKDVCAAYVSPCRYCCDIKSRSHKPEGNRQQKLEGLSLLGKVHRFAVCMCIAV